MRILMICHFFPPEIGAPQVRLSSFAKMWAAGGDDVTVLTTMPNYPSGVIPTEYRRRILRIEQKDGYRIVRTWLYAKRHQGMVGKTIGHLTFMVSGLFLGGGACGRPDVVLVSSPTLFSIATGWALARLKRAHLVVEVRDLWPAAVKDLGVMKNRWAIGLLERFELAAYAAADLVVVASEGFRLNLIDRGVDADKIHTIPNGVNFAEFDTDMRADPALRSRLGAKRGDCLVLYAGTHGLQQGLSTVVHAAARLQNEAIHFSLVGEGVEKELLQQLVVKTGLKNITFAPNVPHEQIPTLLATADICLVVQRAVPLFSISIPAKLSEYLASSRAVIGAVSGESARILNEAGALVVPAEDSVALAEAIRPLADDSNLREIMGSQARSYVEKFFDRAELARRYKRLLATLKVDWTS